MPYFSHGDERKKLMLLFFLNEVDFELTRNEFFRIFAEQGLMEYFDFQALLSELEEDAHVAAIPMAFGQGYRISQKGAETLSLFRENLPHSLRKKLEILADENRALIKENSQFSASHTRLPDGGYLALFKLMDKQKNMLGLSLELPTAALAKEACDAWPNKAQGIYQMLLFELLHEQNEPVD
ncbi:MAG TPA: DUF4364 family protein [Clostridia bacterium]|nr:DUF4364 family protein [Clostridia bacterium]HOR13379.1 DUF4364 family protein [Clostridia bacterium]